MPKTFWQSVLFTTVMATFMVLIMSTYNMALHSNGSVFFVGLSNFFAELIFSLPIALFIAGRIAPVLAFRLVGKTQSMFVISATITLFIAGIMVPVMALFVLIRKYGFDGVTLPMYLHSIVLNFIMAFSVQVLFLGHLVRFLFRNLMGILYNIRCYCASIRTILHYQISILTTKILIIANALAVCLMSAI